MGKKFKALVILLIICMVGSVFAGCKTGTTEATKPTGQKTVLTIGMAGKGRTDLATSKGEYQDDCWATKYIQTKFGDPNNIQIKFQLIEDTNNSSIQNYQIMMAAKSAPDLFFMNCGEIASVLNMAKSGALANLKTSLDKYGPNIKKLLGDDFIKKNGTFYGNLVTIPGKESIPAISHYWIRTDWLDALGLKMPTTFDEWYSVMKAFKTRAKDLEKAGCVKKADDVIPYGMYDTKYFTDWERIVTRFYPTKYFNPKNKEYYIDSGYGIEYNKQGFKEGMQFMNSMYQDGLISQNFALDTEKKQLGRDIVNGNVGSYCDNLFSGWGVSSDPSTDWQNLCKQNMPNSKWDWCHPFTNKYDNVVRNPLDTSVMSYAFVPAYSKHVNEAIKYLNFVTQSDNMVAIQYGVKDVSYTMDPVLGPMLKDNAALTAWGHRLGGRDLVMIGRLPNDSWSRVQRSHAKTATEAAYAEKIHKGIEENGYVRFPLEISGVKEKGTIGGALRTPWNKFVSSLIMAKKGDFDSTWTSGVNELKATGADTLVEANEKQIKDMGIIK